MVSTTTAVILILIGTALDRKNLASVEHTPVSFVNYALAFATISFAYGGHSAFPTIQHDMKTPSKFPQAVFIAYVSKLDPQSLNRLSIYLLALFFSCSGFLYASFNSWIRCVRKRDNSQRKHLTEH